MSVTFETFQLLMVWLKDVPINMDFILVTFETSQLLMFWLNAELVLNIASMFLTFDTFHVFIGELNLLYKNVHQHHHHENQMLIYNY